MDSENVRTIVTGLVAVVVGIVPATFLYLQNKRSGEREATERAALREAEELRRSAGERAALTEAKERAYSAKRERFLRYSRSVEDISASIRLSGDGYGYDLPEALRAETTAAYEDIMLSPSEEVRNAAAAVRSFTEVLIRQATNFNSTPAQEHIDRVEGALEAYRIACRNNLRPSTAVEP